MSISLKILGRISPNVFLNFPKSLEFDLNNSSEFVCFCDYSATDIPLNYQFHYVESYPKMLRVESAVTLLKITQQFAISEDHIAAGWKTICKFKVEKEESISIFRSLQSLEMWENRKIYIILT